MASKKFRRRVLPLIMAATMVAACFPAMAATEDPWSISDATKTELTYTIDGKELAVTQYVDYYLKDTGELEASASFDEFENAKVNIFVPETATTKSPILYMVDNSGWRSNDYSATLKAEGNAAMALKNGYIVVTAGLRTRGNDFAGDGDYNKSPVTVADAKAVIRYLRHNNVGNTDMIFITGTSGGGALSVAIGANGNSKDFYDELYKIGAAGMTNATTSTIKDDIFGVIAYCPITDLGHSDGSYEFTFAGARADLVEEGVSTPVAGDPYDLGFPAKGQYTLGAQSLAMSPALAESWADYVNSIGIAGVNAAFDEATLTASGTLYDGMKALLIESLQSGLDKLGADAFEASIKAETADLGNYIVDDTKLSADWQIRWLEYTDDTRTKIKDIDMAEYLFYVALQQNIKPAPAFTNDGLGLMGVFFNENNLFGPATDAHGYNLKVVYDASDLATRESWDAYWAANGALIEKQVKMVDSIAYLTDASGESDSAPYWWVRHGSLDRDTGFANQTLLYYAMNSATAGIKEADFAFEYGLGHTGGYNTAEVESFMAASIKDATPAPAPTPSTPSSPQTGDATMLPLLAVVVAVGAVALAGTRRRVVR